LIDVQEWTPGDDPMLALLPPDPPWRFQRLPREEQAWRARAFLMLYGRGSTLPHSWWYALLERPDQITEMKALQASIPDLDNRIMTALRTRAEGEALEKARQS
jgi:hypothetical protein